MDDELKEVFDVLKVDDPRLEKCTCEAKHLFAFGHVDTCPYVVVKAPKATPCKCGEDFKDDVNIPRGYCKCGIDNDHSHCLDCGGWVCIG